MVVNDVLQDNRYRSIKGWQAGSEMCVAIREGEKILGIIDVESSSRNAFTHNDFIALESLAGILASVITSADQYQRLQVTISQLQSMQMELRARMEAQRAAENRLVQAAKLAAVGEMAAGIAHELNNPLTSVTGFAELALDAMPEDSQTRGDLELVMREAIRARDVVRRLLDFARQSESTRASASLNEVVEDVVALSRHLIHTSRSGTKLEFEQDLPWVPVDANQMKQVLLNLVHNALQAMPDGGEMKIATVPRSRFGRDGVIVSVRDTGIGIPQPEQARIFEPFYTTKGDHGGYGPGLSVTYGIVTDHGGQIEVESAAWCGRQNLQYGCRKPKEGMEAISVLVVDDEPGIALLCKRILSRAGYDVTSETDPRVAIEQLQQIHVDLLLVDIRMPEVDGFDVISRAQVVQPDIAVLVMTGFGTVETAIRALRQGVDGLLLKPFNKSEELLQAVRQALIG